jgi:hypothetical protein
MQPLATLLFDAIGGEWLVVAPDGTYDASEHGTELAGWRIGAHIAPLGMNPSRRKPELLPQILMKAGIPDGHGNH